MIGKNKSGKIRNSLLLIVNMYFPQELSNTIIIKFLSNA